MNKYEANRGVGHNSINKCYAFTLAEVLITLVIIGVVAALTIPTVITNYQKNQYVTQLKKFYTQTTNGFRAYMASQGVTRLSDTDLIVKIYGSSVSVNTLLSANANDKPFQNEFNKIFKVLKLYSVADVQSTYPGLKINYLKSTTGSNVDYTVAGIVELSDGSIMNYVLFTKSTVYASICGDSHNEACKSLKELQRAEKELNLPSTSLYARVGIIYVDVNGYKAPNTYGRDIFYFAVGDDGILYPYGSPDVAVHGYGSSYTNYIWSGFTNDCFTERLNTSGIGCAARIMAEGWKMNY